VLLDLLKMTAPEASGPELGRITTRLPIAITVTIGITVTITVTITIPAGAGVREILASLAPGPRLGHHRGRIPTADQPNDEHDGEPRGSGSSEIHASKRHHQPLAFSSFCQ
jgi:hypothetical protein